MITKQQIEDWIGGDNTTEACLDLIADLANKQYSISTMILEINEIEVLKKFKGVQTLYHCENDEVKKYVLESLDNMPQEHKDIWENISYGNDLCDSFHFGGHKYIDQEIHLKFFAPNSFDNNIDNEQYSKWTLLREDGHSRILLIDGAEYMEFEELSTLLVYVKENLGDLTFKK